MIGLAKACPGGGSLLAYVMNAKKGYELDRNNLCGINGQEILEEFRILQQLNQRSTNKFFSLVLSPEISDGETMTDATMRAITQTYLTELGIDTQQQQYITFVHTEKKHKHIHIICNRVVATTGKLINDHHIGKRAQWVAHKIAKKNNLISAKQLMIDKLTYAKTDDTTSLKQQILKKHLQALEKHLNSFESYQKQMKEMGVLVEPTLNKQGMVQGHRLIDTQTNQSFKASEIHRKLNLQQIGTEPQKQTTTKKLNR